MIRKVSEVAGASGPYRRRIRTEEKANVDASVWWEEFIQFLAELSFLPRTILSKRINCTRMI